MYYLNVLTSSQLLDAHRADLYMEGDCSSLRSPLLVQLSQESQQLDIYDTIAYHPNQKHSLLSYHYVLT